MLFLVHPMHHHTSWTSMSGKLLSASIVPKPLTLPLSRGERENMSFPSRLLLRLLLNIAFLWILKKYVGEIFLLTGGVPALLIMGFLLTAIDLLVRPFLSLITLPLRLFLSLFNILVLSGLSLGILAFLSREFPPEILTLMLVGGFRDLFLLVAVFSLRDTILRFLLR